MLNEWKFKNDQNCTLNFDCCELYDFAYMLWWHNKWYLKSFKPSIILKHPQYFFRIINIDIFLTIHRQIFEGSRLAVAQFRIWMPEYTTYPEGILCHKKRRFNRQSQNTTKHSTNSLVATLKMHVKQCQMWWNGNQRSNCGRILKGKNIWTFVG